MMVHTDRDKYGIPRIVGFYERQPTDYADYFAAAWRYRYRVALGQPRAKLAEIAAESGVSSNYSPPSGKSSTPARTSGRSPTSNPLWNALPARLRDLARLQWTSDPNASPCGTSW